LARFEKIVNAKGGELKVTSAFRPASYQQHLQQVWEKWMHELRYNVEPGCEKLKAQVGREFARHALLERQRPVPVSDHTLGIGFDAAITLPPVAHKKSRMASLLDRLAHVCRLRRPDILHDPVHFRFTGVSRKSQIAKVMAVSFRRHGSS
jgi:hypothetical protein